MMDIEKSIGKWLISKDYNFDDFMWICKSADYKLLSIYKV